MNEQIEIKKVPIYKRKAIMVPAILMVMAVIAYAAVTYSSVAVSVTVNEALSTTNVSVTIGGLFPGETSNSSVDITNAANVSLNTNLSWTENTNPDGVTYTTDMPKTIVLAPGVNNVPFSFTIDNASNAGNFTGTVTLTRV